MANLLAQAAYIENPNLDFECHTFNAPGAQEIRKYSLAMPEITETVLKEHIWNHVRFLDPVGHINTHEGSVFFYNTVPTNNHAITHFVQELELLVKTGK